MIFYFSGTGNSLHIATRISRSLGEGLISIPVEMNKNENTLSYNIKEGGYIGFVYPVHAWGPPKIVLDFIDKIQLSKGMPYVFSVATCGGEEGDTTKILKLHLAKKGIPLSSAFTIDMPNNYIIGSDVESKEKILEKLAAADKKTDEILRIIKNKEHDVFNLNPGSFPTLKTKVVNPFFKKYALDIKHFNVDDNCNGCGLCENVCPLNSIKVNGKPIWSGECSMCLACINRCPTHAIQYDKKTINKGRYVHPDLV